VHLQNPLIFNLSGACLVSLVAAAPAAAAAAAVVVVLELKKIDFLPSTN